MSPFSDIKIVYQTGPDAISNPPLRESCLSPYKLAYSYKWASLCLTFLAIYVLPVINQSNDLRAENFYWLLTSMRMINVWKCIIYMFPEYVMVHVQHVIWWLMVFSHGSQQNIFKSSKNEEKLKKPSCQDDLFSFTLLFSHDVLLVRNENSLLSWPVSCLTP